MKITYWLGSLLVCAAAGLSAPAHAVSAEATGTDARMLAKIAKTRVKQATAGQTQSDDSGKRGCDVNIGNSVTNRPGDGPREITVVVQGDVIQADNKCR